MGRWSGARIDYMTFPFIKQEMSWRDPAREHQPQQYHATLAMQIFKVVFMTFRRSLSNLIWYISTDRGEKITIKSNWINSPNQKLCLANMFRTQLWLLRDSGRARSEGGTWNIALWAYTGVSLSGLITCLEFNLWGMKQKANDKLLQGLSRKNCLKTFFSQMDIKRDVSCGHMLPHSATYCTQQYTTPVL